MSTIRHPVRVVLRRGPVVAIALVLAVLAAVVVVAAAFGLVAGWPAGVAGLVVVASVQAIVLAPSGSSLEAYASKPRAEDGSPGWWPEFERDFRRVSERA